MPEAEPAERVEPRDERETCAQQALECCLKSLNLRFGT